MKREFPEEQEQQQQSSLHHHTMFTTSSTKLHHHHRPPHDSSSDSPTLLLPPPPDAAPATIDLPRRPRGRPPGSKNKPKPPVIITASDSSDPPMSPYVLELPPGADIVDSITRFSRKRNIGLAILNGNGLVSNVTLKQPTPGSTVTFHGRFDLLSISATLMPPGSPASGGHFAISLAGPQGQVVGGLVVPPLVAAGTIYLIAASFNSPSYHRLQSGEDEGNGGGAGRGDEHAAAAAECGGEGFGGYLGPPPPPY